MPIDWRSVWKSGVVEELGRDCSTLPELAVALSNRLGELVSDNAIGASNRRLRVELGLQPASHYLRGLLPAQLEGHQIKGVSSLLNDKGEVTRQWVKTVQGKEDRLHSLMEKLPSILARIPQRVVIQAPTLSNKDLLCIYPMGDPHIGLYAWYKETGQQWNLKMGRETLMKALDFLVEGAPPAEHALIVPVGDGLHTDNYSNRTTRSGAALDVDGRWPELMECFIDILCYSVDRALEKHKKVTLIVEFGNHDDQSAYMSALCLAHHYRDNPRVTVDTSPAKYHWYRFGQNLFGVTHGDTVKKDELPLLMAADRKEDWGETEYRFWYTGHIHHETKKDIKGVIVESFRTLAGRDAWHHAQGYRSGSDMHCDTYHRQYGRCGRATVGIQQVMDLVETDD